MSDRKPLVNIGALWKANSKSKAVLTGKLEDGRKVWVFRNERKKEEKHPDYRLVAEGAGEDELEPPPGRRPDDDETPF